MRRKVVWLVVSCLMVLALLVTSCAQAEEKAPAPVVKEAAPVVKEAAPVVKEAAPAVKEAAPAEAKGMVKVTLKKVDGTPVEKLVEKPKYGGQLILARTTPITAFDEAYQGPWTVGPNMAMTNNELVNGDWRRGQAGTGEASWLYPEYLIQENLTGDLAESWEFPDDTTIIFHIRKGVKYVLDPNSAASRLVNGREFTADDVVFNIRRIFLEIKTSTMYSFAGAATRPVDVYATDKYTVVVKSQPGQLGYTFDYTAGWVRHVPPEVVKKYGDMNQWENVVGTGPFILTDNVPMSSTTWKRNPNYWEYDPILGKDYPLPYVDGIKVLDIPDLSTRMAALRTGRIDAQIGGRYATVDAMPLFKSNPNLQYTQVYPASMKPLGFTQGRGLPFDDIRVRRALMMGINNQAIIDYYGGDAEVLNYKVPGAKEYRDLGWHTPLEELPPETRELYTYNPEKAKKLLAEAGYPQGFKTEVVLQTVYPFPDLGVMVKADWAKIGVDLTLDFKEWAVEYSIYQKKTFKEMLWHTRGGSVGALLLNRKGNMYNWALIDDPKIDDYYYPELQKAFFDAPKKSKLMKEMNLYVLSKAWYYSPPEPYSYTIWQPWLKNYYGLYGPALYANPNWIRYVWLDQELKKEMGH